MASVAHALMRKHPHVNTRRQFSVAVVLGALARVHLRVANRTTPAWCACAGMRVDLVNAGGTVCAR